MSMALGAGLSLLATPAFAAAPCNTGNFDSWLAAFKTEAVSKGISQQTANTALTGITLDQSVLNRDHSQKVFDQTFEQFSGRMVPPRMTRGSNALKQYGSVLGRIETAYGVPGEVIVAALLVVGSLPLFLGLAVVIPLLGHATWHLYREVVAIDPNAQPIPPPPPRQRKPAADFPANLFPWRRKDDT